MINGSSPMEDTVSEDTMMECGSGFDNFDDEATNRFMDSAPTIKDATEKLLTLLEIDDFDDDISLSEDEGVDSDMSDDEDSNYNLLHQLALSLKHEQEQQPRKTSLDRPRNQNSSTYEFPASGRFCGEENTGFLRKIEHDSWISGWDECAAESLRYLVEIEGLSNCHPTVLAVKRHLEVQRQRLLTPFTT